MKLTVLASALLGAFLSTTGLPALAHNAPAEIDHLMAQEMASRNIYRAHFPDEDTGRKAAISFHANLLESHWKDGYLVLQLEPEDIAKLQAFNFRISRDDSFLAKRDDMLRRLRAAGHAQHLWPGRLQPPGCSRCCGHRVHPRLRLL